MKNVFSKLIAVNETQPKTESRGEKERAEIIIIIIIIITLLMKLII